jgi:XTP/dITP diphosphohydrolase
LSQKPKPDRTLYLVGLGPGPVDLLSLRAWELLASGHPLAVRNADHETAQTAASRGIRFVELGERHPAETAEAVIAWTGDKDQSVYATPGHPLEAPETIPILEQAHEQGLAIEIVPGFTDAERLPAFDVVTRAHATPQAIRAGLAFIRLVQVMARLRGPVGCPWDREQTHESLAVHLLEETYETLDAIDRADSDVLAEELGDLLLQVAFHSELAREANEFEVTDVVEGLLKKLFNRHPHVFGDAVANDARQVVHNWEALKRKEKGRELDSEDIPGNLPALLYAYKVLRRMSGRSNESISSGKMVDEKWVGDALLEIVAAAVEAGVDPEGALRRRAREVLEASA